MKKWDIRFLAGKNSLARKCDFGFWRENSIYRFCGKWDFSVLAWKCDFWFWWKNKFSVFFFAEKLNYLVLVKTIFSDYGEKMRFLGFNGKEISSFGGKSVCLFFFVSAEKWDFSVLTWKLNFFSFDGKTIILLCAKNEIFSFGRKTNFQFWQKNEIFGFDRKRDFRFWQKTRYLVLT